MAKADALFTALNKGEKIKALQICFEDAGDDPQERKFCCILAQKVGVTPENAPEDLKDDLSSCPLVLNP
jgi:hypothetical protein